MIISRYLTKEVAGALFAVTFVLLLVFLSNQLVRYLSYAASGKIAANILMQLMGFEIPYLLALLLPLGLYLGIILAYGRLYAESEMRVLQACGLSMKQLIGITSILVTLVAIMVCVLMWWVNPWIASQKDKLIVQSLTTENVLDTLMPGRFQVSSDGKRVVYVEKISRNHRRADNLFLADQSKIPSEENGSWIVVSAAQGAQVIEPVSQDRFIEARDGFRYEGTPGQNAYKIIQFKKYSVLTPRTVMHSMRQQEEGIPTLKLLRNHESTDLTAELQWRFSIPLSVFLLALLAVPLSHVKPRHGKYSQLLPAVLIYIVYMNLLFVARNWIEQKTVPGMIGMWWVHLLLFIIAMLLLMLQSGWSFRRKTA